MYMFYSRVVVCRLDFGWCTSQRECCFLVSCCFFLCFVVFFLLFCLLVFFFFQAEDGIRDLVRSRGLGDVYKRQNEANNSNPSSFISVKFPAAVFH